MKRAQLIASLHRMLPGWSVGPLARAAAARDARHPATMERAREGMHLLLDGVRPDASAEEIDDLARRYLFEMRKQNEARWHLRLSRPLPVQGIERLASLEGRAMVHIVHHGPFLLIGPSMAQSGREVHVVADDSLCTAQPGTWQAQTHAVASQGCTLFSAAEGAAAIRDRLARDLVVVVATDVPGRTPVEFLGRRLVGSSGAVRTAYDSGTPVLSATMHRDDRGAPFYRLTEPLRPADFDSTEALLQELLRRQEESVLAWPEAYYDPLTKWALEEPSGTPHLLRGSS